MAKARTQPRRQSKVGATTARINPIVLRYVLTSKLLREKLDPRNERRRKKMETRKTEGAGRSGGARRGGGRQAELAVSSEHDGALGQLAEPGEERVLPLQLALPLLRRQQRRRVERRRGRVQRRPVPRRVLVEPPEVEALLLLFRRHRRDLSRLHQTHSNLLVLLRFRFLHFGFVRLTVRSTSLGRFDRLRLGRGRLRGLLVLVAPAALGLRRRVVVLEGVGDEQQGGVRAAALHLLPRRAPLGAAATVVPPVESRDEEEVTKPRTN
jgi:hypothetical protein